MSLEVAKRCLSVNPWYRSTPLDTVINFVDLEQVDHCESLADVSFDDSLNKHSFILNKGIIHCIFLPKLHFVIFPLVDFSPKEAQG